MTAMNGYATAPMTVYKNEFYHGLGVCRKGSDSGKPKTFTNVWNEGKGVKDPPGAPKPKEKWMQGAVKRPGAFTKKAKAAHMGTQAFAKSVSAHPEKHSTRTVRQANLAKTFAKFRKK